jgi:hypothetical protein
MLAGQRKAHPIQGITASRLATGKGITPSLSRRPGWTRELGLISVGIRTVVAHVEERYTRVDHNDLKLTVTVDDPTLYTKPFVLGTASFTWLPSQELDEQLCVPSDLLHYMKSMGDFEKPDKK